MGSKALPAGMKLGSGNPIIEEALGDRLVGGRREAAELSVSDFDGSRWKLACARGAGAEAWPRPRRSRGVRGPLRATRASVFGTFGRALEPRRRVAALVRGTLA